MSYSSKYIDQLSQGNLQLVETAHGEFIPMLRIKKFPLNEIAITLSGDPFPAFMIDGVETEEILISQFTYPAGAGMKPERNISLHDARVKASAFGAGFHLLTAWEWAAMMWFYRDYWGQERGPTEETGPIENAGGSFFYRTPQAWWGIWGLTGNLYEYCDGVQFRGGKLYGPPENNLSNMNATDENDISLWPEIGNAQYHANEPFPSAPIYGDIAQKLFLNGYLLEKYPNGQTFALESQDSLVLERGGAYHSGDEAGLGCLRFTASPTAVREDAGFRVAYVAPA